MLQLAVTDGRQPVQRVVARDFPFTIGRSPRSSLRLEFPGVWDEHAAIRLDPASKKLVISALGETMLLVNGSRCHEAILFVGDRVQLGAAEVQIGFSPVVHAPLGASERITWLLWLVVLLVQIILLARLN